MSEVAAIKKLVDGASTVPVFMKDSRGVEHILRPVIGQGGIVEYKRDEITPKTEIRPRPAFINQAVNLHDTDSLIAYINRYKTDDTIVLADYDEMAITASIDYHKEGSAAPGLVEHYAVLPLTPSEQWTTWMAIGSKLHSQAEFANLLDVNMEDISEPMTGSALLELILDIETNVSIKVNRKFAHSGSNAGHGGDEIKISASGLPPYFVLSIPVFMGEKDVLVKAQTIEQTDTATGKKFFTLKPLRTKIIMQNELRRIAGEIEVETLVPVMQGALKEK